MKFRRIFVVSLTALSLLLASCGGSKLKDPITEESESIVGEFKSLGGIKVDKMITHLFEDEDGNIYYAFSDRYDLDEELGEAVEASGTVMEFEDLDKPAFKITRISEAPEEDEEDEEVIEVDYVDTDLGFSLSYPNNWTLESLRDSIELTAPAASDEEEDEEDEEESEDAPSESDEARDVIVVALIEVQLRTTSDDDASARATDIHTQISQLYADLTELEGEVTMIGVDQQFAVRYKKESGDVYYFVPRNNGLLELSFYNVDGDGEVENSNTFAQIVSTLRLLPVGDDGEFIQDEAEDTPLPSDEDEEDTEEAPTPSGDQASVQKYREFESNPYKFTISYPAHWYYSGGNKGYEFSQEPIEEEGEVLIRLEINANSSTGVVRTGSTVKITVKVGESFYTLSGPSEYENIMNTMAESIEAVTQE